MNWIRRRETWLALAGGALAALSMPGFGAWPLVFVALVPLGVALERGRGFQHGYLFGIALFAIDARWVVALSRFNPLVIPGYVLLVLYLALPLGMVGWLLTWRSDRVARWRWVLLAPALIVLVEWLRTLGPLGFGFSMLHQSLYRVPWLIGSAAVLGAWSVTGTVVAVNASAYLAWRRRPVYALLGTGALIAQVALWFALGPIEPIAEPMDIAVVSSTVDQAVKLDGRNLEPLTERFLDLGAQAAAGDPDLIVFPESFLPAYILRRDDLLSELASLARAGDARLLFGTGDWRNGRIYNTVVLLGTDGEIIGRYDMVRPVPFGEYIPGRRLLEAIGLGAWARAVLPLDLTRGTDTSPVDGIGTPICFESTFPSTARSMTRQGATLLVTVTNDAWFGGSSELDAHFAATVFRAVENRRFVVQAANGGVSGIVDPRGRIVVATTEEKVVTGSVTLTRDRALYTQWGDTPWLLTMAAAVVGGLGAVACRRRPGRPRSG